MIAIYQVDAFAEKVFQGNPAAVIPLENWLDDALMQRIALENNLSETAFFVKNGPHPNLPPVGEGTANTQTSLKQDVNRNRVSPKSEDSEWVTPPPGEPEGAGPSYHLRWFTPEYEIDLCGHATLASAYIIKNFLEPHVAEINFTTQKAGVLKASAKDGMYTLDFPVRMPQTCEVPDTLLSSLGVTTVVEVLKSRDYFVVLPDEAAVKNVEPDFSLMKELDTIGVIVTAKGQEADVVSRCFYPGAGIPEDPVTGSAHCNIVPYWSEKLGKTKLFCKQLSARGGDLQCEFNGDRVLMSGKCVLYMQGNLNHDLDGFL